MEHALTALQSASALAFAALLSAAVASFLSVRLCGCVTSSVMRRLKRPALVVLAALAAVATIEAQKRTVGEAAGVAAVSEADGDGGGAPPGEAATNSLHFAAISVCTNEIALTLAWPDGLLAAGSVVDLFAATSLVGSAWIWLSAHEVPAGETAWTSAAARDSGFRFFMASVRADPGDMRDTDGDGIPDAYELRNGTNPYVPDYAAAPRIVAGGEGGVESLAAALAASEPYSIIEVAPGVHSGAGWTGLHLPAHPVLVTSPDGGRSRTATLRHGGQMAAFYLSATQRTDTVVQGLNIDLVAADGQQMGFWCGGSLPWSGAPAAGTFRNISVRMPNPGVRYFGWFFRHWESNEVVIAACQLNASGATDVRGVYAVDSPPMSVENCTFANFPPGEGDTLGYGIQYETTAANWGGAPDAIPLEIANCLFDASFTNAYALAPLEQGVAYDVAMVDCIVPSPLTYPPDRECGTMVTNAMTAWSGHLLPGSPAIDAGGGALHSPFDIDGQYRDARADIGADEYVADAARDTDGDGIPDMDETAVHGTDPYRADTDFDGEADADELLGGTDPANPRSFTQTLTVAVTNTVAPAHPVYVAWGFSASGWETNGLAAFAEGHGAATYTDASSHGAAYVKAFCDLDGDGEYSASADVMLSREIPCGSTARIVFAFGDLDGDGVSDAQERADGTDPYDMDNFRINVMVKITNNDNVPAITNYLAYGFSPMDWETNGLVSFAKLDVQPRSMHIVDDVDNGSLYVKCYRDIDCNGMYDSDVDVLYVRQIGGGYNGREYAFTIGDFDGDRIPDSTELDEGTDPLNQGDYCFSMAATVTGIFHTTNQLTLSATFGTNVIYGPMVVTTNVWSHDFGHLTANNEERVNLTFWDDANSNGVREVEEATANLTLSITNHANVLSYRLSCGAFDANHNDLPDWWEVESGLAAEGVANRPYDDPDGDGLVNLHEYWAGTDPLVPDGSNTLLSVAARSIDDRIRGVDPASSVARFADYFTNGSNGVFQANTNFWARDLDLSCVSVWQHDGDEPGSKSATLITRRHVVLADHWWNWRNRLYSFCDTNGLVCVRTLLQTQKIYVDLTIGQLNEPLPESFKPAKVLPVDFDRHISFSKYLPALCMNHKKDASVAELAYLDGKMGNYSHYGSTSHTNFVSVQRCNMRGATWDGNSGCPVFLVVGDELVMLFAKHTGTRGNVTWASFYGPMVGFQLDAVQSQIDEWEGVDAGLYQVETLDLSEFGELVNME